MLVMFKTKSYVRCTNWDFELADGGVGWGGLDIVVWI